MKTFRLLFILVMGIYSFPISAVPVSGLYQTTVSVADESISSRTNALKKAMQQVLVKLSGNINIINQSGANEIINRAQDYVQQFRYQQSQELLEILVKFDENALNQAMRTYALTLWGRERPAVIVWLVNESDSGRQMVSLEDSPEILSSLEKAAMTRGVPLLFPLFDLQDREQLSVSDVWAGFKEPVLNASRRYQADAVLIGKMSPFGATGADTQWTLFLDDQTQNWSAQGDLPELVLTESMNRLADSLANQYAKITNSGGELLQVTVSNIYNLKDYASTLLYLESLQAVTEVMVKQVNQGEVVFELISHGGRLAINQAIRLGNVLQLAGDESSGLYRLQ